MVTQKDKAGLFRSLHVAGDPLVLYNIWDAGSAKAVAAGGARAIATGSWSVAAANGFADGEQVPFDLVLGNLRRIAGATDLPVSVDLESGYGADAAAVGRTVSAAIEAGAIGCNLEDSFPDSGILRDIAEQAERVAHARKAADDAGIAFFLNARVDVFLRSPRESHDRMMVDAALERGRRFAGSGADGLFLPGLAEPALIEQAVQGSPLPVNIMVADRTPIPALSALGVARISYGANPWRALMKLLEDAARAAM